MLVGSCFFSPNLVAFFLVQAKGRKLKFFGQFTYIGGACSVDFIGRYWKQFKCVSLEVV